MSGKKIEANIAGFSGLYQVKEGLIDGQKFDIISMQLPHFVKHYLKGNPAPKCNMDYVGFIWLFGRVNPSTIDEVFVELDFDTNYAHIWWTNGLHQQQKGS